MIEAVNFCETNRYWKPVIAICLLTLISACDQAQTEQGLERQSVSSETMAPKTNLTKEEEFVQWMNLAETGDAKAQYELGRMYSEGIGTTENYTKAFEWLQKSANQGHAGAQATLGMMYFKGEGTTRDESKAAEWIRKSAAQGYDPGQGMLGYLYHYGYGVTKNPIKAFEFYEKSALQGNTGAQTSLADLYRKGIGTPKNFEKAVEWLTKSAEQGSVVAQFELAGMYLNGEGVTRDIVISYAWSNLAAAKNSKYATFRDLLENDLTQSQLQEAQRLASNWRKGEVLQANGELSHDSTTSRGKTRKQSTGTAFMVSKNGHALTNHHVIDGCIELRVSGSEGVVKVIASDRFNDLALIQKVGDSSVIARINPDPEKLRQGEDIIVFGYPLQSALSSGGNLTQGTVSAVTGLGNNTNQIQITAPIQLGSSGSPVMNKSGDVVGVVSMKLSDSKMLKNTGEIGQNVNFAVSGQTVKTFLDVNKVPYKTGGGFFSRTKSNTQIAEEAQRWTVLLECWK